MVRGRRRPPSGRWRLVPLTLAIALVNHRGRAEAMAASQSASFASVCRPRWRRRLLSTFLTRVGSLPMAVSASPAAGVLRRNVGALALGRIGRQQREADRPRWRGARGCWRTGLGGGRRRQQPGRRVDEALTAPTIDLLVGALNRAAVLQPSISCAAAGCHWPTAVTAAGIAVGRLRTASASS